MVELIVFAIAGVVVLGGALGVILTPNTTRAALSLVATLFGIAVLFIAQDAHFLAAVQVIVYAGAIVVLFLFVMMLLGVDRDEDLRIEPLRGQRWAAIAGGAAFLAVVLVALLAGERTLTGQRGSLLFDQGLDPNIVLIGRDLFTNHVLAFEATALLLTIAVVGAVVLVRKVSNESTRPTDEEVSS
ncbi:NADH-quinone oxidoreductase subunit J [Actinomarinicola tropica]|uniref:NADH-quinone oxidoreductase subunit J n=1 Tax=Actinomarinicola tropica TaxID=2789776 RepID=A0A5Q2RJ03_9ACTN|nr:NADH-quinone oxidoreductase subunit J [Actinomarinicola tropica]QGG93810.1 NADH-quinone oxidoreductase subunit J [Actinomarinicola tropica]